jgi:hypothetical protein
MPSLSYFSGLKDYYIEPKIGIFPVFSQGNREFETETGSQQTATTANYNNQAYVFMGFFVFIASVTINLTINFRSG